MCACSSAHYVCIHMYMLCLITVAAGTPPKVPEGAQQVFMDKLLFWEFPHFLPASGFSMCTNIRTLLGFLVT